MADKRMFTQKIVDSDQFLDMPLSTQALYFHLNMRADDDGFINNPKRIMRTVGASEDDLKVLLAKRFVIGFETGVIVIKHWRMHNTLKKDRYNPTQYQEELAMLDVKDNKAYTERPYGAVLEPAWNQSGTKLEPQYSVVEISRVEERLVEDSIEAAPEPAPAKVKRHKYGEYDNVLLSDEEFHKLQAEFPQDWKARIDRLSGYIASHGKSYKNHLATIRNWARKDKEQAVQSGTGFETGNPFLEMLNERRGNHDL